MNSKETSVKVQTQKFLLAFHFFMSNFREILKDILEILYQWKIVHCVQKITNIFVSCTKQMNDIISTHGHLKQIYYNSLEIASSKITKPSFKNKRLKFRI